MAHPLTRFIESVTVQDAVYWGGLRPGGGTSYNYSIIKEIKVRWDTSDELMREQIGEESTSTSVLLVNEELDIGGYVMVDATLGEEVGDYRKILLNGREVFDKNGEVITTEYHPKALAPAYQIKKFTKNPLFRSKVDFVMKAYL